VHRGARPRDPGGIRSQALATVPWGMLGTQRMKLALPLALCIGALACGDPTGPETPIDGKQIYDQYCARCHGFDGGGVAEVPAANGRLNNMVLMQSKSDQQIMGVIRGGKPPAMPGFAGEFTEAKLMVLTAYVRSLSLPGTGEAQRPQAQPAAGE